MNDNICISLRDFKIYAYLLILILSFNVYILSTYKKEGYENINDKKTQSIMNELNNCKKQAYLYQKDLNTALQKLRELSYSKTPSLNTPERLYINPYQDVNNEYQNVGYIYNSNQRYPLYGRYKDQRSDKWEYYIIDDSKNKIKIPIITKNYYELLDNDTLNIPELNDTFSVKLYEIKNYKYNPNV